MDEGTLLPFALEGMVAPMLIVFAICGIAIWFRLPRISALGLAAASLAPIVLAYAPAYPPSRLLDDLPYFGLAAFVLFLPFDLKNLPEIFRHGLCWLFSLALVWLLLRPMFAKWSIQEAAENLAACVAVWALIWSNIESVSKTRPTGIFMLAIAAAGGGVTLYAASNALLGQMSLSLGIALASWLFLARVDPGMKAGKSGLATVYTLFAGLILISAYYSEIPRGLILLVLSTFLADMLVQILLQFKPDISDSTANSITAGVALIPGAIVLGASALNLYTGS